MSIVTRTGDAGTTALMYGRRVSKCHPRVEAVGSVDELNASLGLARAWSSDPADRDRLQQIQRSLISLMGELATHPDDLDRYRRDGFFRIDASFTASLDGWVQELESQSRTFLGWATPGANPAAAALDVARTVCRRAERFVCAIQDHEQLGNPEIVIYLNRLSDLLWLMARKAETAVGPTVSPSAG